MAYGKRHYLTTYYSRLPKLTSQIACRRNSAAVQAPSDEPSDDGGHRKSRRQRKVSPSHLRTGKQAQRGSLRPIELIPEASTFRQKCPGHRPHGLIKPNARFSLKNATVSNCLILAKGRVERADRDNHGCEQLRRKVDICDERQAPR